jgi:hypothetical protein
MLIDSIYPKHVAEYISISKNNYIPRHIKENEHLKQFHRYLDIYDNFPFKVEEVQYISDTEYYNVRYPDYLYAEIPFPLSSYYIMELLHDNNGIESLDNIINSRKSFTGAEIKYWFFIHRIDIEDKKYCGFWSFINPNSKNVISDDKYYFIKGDYEDDMYKKCKISLDKYRRCNR